MREGGLLHTLLACSECAQMPCACAVENVPRDPVTVFLNRWIPRVMNAEHRPTIEKELRELIAEAKVE